MKSKDGTEPVASSTNTQQQHSTHNFLKSLYATEKQNMLLNKARNVVDTETALKTSSLAGETAALAASSSASATALSSVSSSSSLSSSSVLATAQKSTKYKYPKQKGSSSSAPETVILVTSSVNEKQILEKAFRR